MAKLVSINPTTGEVLGEVAATPESELRAIVARARDDRSWRGVGARDRADIVSRLAALLEDDREDLAQTMAREMGKPVRAGRYEVDLAATRVRAYCDQVPGYIAPEVLFEDAGEKNVAVFEPMGSAAVISPWNAPVFVSLAAVVPALLCGNNVIWKPSEHVPFASLRLARVFDRLKAEGLPDAAFTAVMGGKETGKALVASDVDVISLTGSVRAGKEVVRASADKLHRFVLELGGKDPAIVLADADVGAAARAIVASATMFTGQVCFAVERVYCSGAIYDDFVSECVRAMDKIRVGDPLEEATDMGPFAVRFQLDTVLDHISDARDKGATVLCGCERIGDRGFFLRPGVLVGVDHTMRIMRDETFGPVLPVMRVDDIGEAVALANDSDYGLSASVWTSDGDRGQAIAERIEAGTVEINRHGMSKPGCPWGGYKSSGIGRLYSKEGIRELTNIKHIWLVRPEGGARTV